MKQIIITMSIMVITILVCMTLWSIASKTERRVELGRAVSLAVKQTVKESQLEEQKKITSNEDMVARFVELLREELVSDRAVTVEVMGVDVTEGMLDVLVSEEFSYPNGRTGELSIRKCAIYE